MSKDIRRIIQESRELLRDASPQQKLRLLKLIKQSMSKLSESRCDRDKELSKNSDYLEEK